MTKKQPIRCKECEYWKPEKSGAGICDKIKNETAETFMGATGPDFYCGYGKAKVETK